MTRIDGMNAGAAGRTMAGNAASGVETGANLAANAGAEEARSGSQDRISVSDRARTMAVVSRSVAATSDVRAEKIASLKAAINNGSYQVDVNGIAARLLRGGSFE
jgi:negative regulator of flagellin synthesis FlgM